MADNLNTNDDAITVLSQEESLELLAGEQLGRVVVVIKDRAEIFPVNYAVSDGKLYFRTAPGTKLFGVVASGEVVFEVDKVIEGAGGWSVIARGGARLLDTMREINEAEELPLKPWLPTLKYNFVEIAVESISGRRFVFGEEPERYVGSYPV